MKFEGFSPKGEELFLGGYMREFQEFYAKMILQFCAKLALQF